MAMDPDGEPQITSHKGGRCPRRVFALNKFSRASSFAWFEIREHSAEKIDIVEEGVAGSRAHRKGGGAERRKQAKWVR
jgi:hypothetical protein